MAARGNGPPVKLRPASFVDAEQFHLKDQGAVRTNFRGGALFAVGQLRREKYLPLVSHLHHLERLGPAGNHVVEGKSGRLAALHGTVKYRPVNQGADIIYRDG